MDLELYGKPLRAYKGSGILHFANGSELGCTFDLVQVSDGGLYALCSSTELDLEAGLQGNMMTKLEGKAEDGRKLVLQHPMLLHGSVGQSDGSVFTHLTIYGEQATVGDPTLPRKTASHVKFGLTNLAFHAGVAFALDGINIAIRPTNTYRDVMRELRARPGVDVTCEVIAEAQSIGDCENIITVVNDLCTLLTLARGCRVDWLYYDVSSPEDDLLVSYHRSAITKPFGNLGLIPTRPPGDTIDFINQTYPNLRAQEQHWELRKAIDAYTDAKLANDYLEFRGLKLAVTVEHLKGRYLSQNNKVHILQPALFDEVTESLINTVRCWLLSVFPEVETDKLDMMANHTRGLNWYPFRRAISDLCNSLGLTINSRDRGQFCNTRNELVHRMAYDPGHGAAWDQYTFMMTFVGKLLLAILGYEGYYYDRTKPPGWIGEDTEMRVKLELEPEKRH